MKKKSSIPVKICQVSGCYNKATNGLYRIERNGDKQWVYVCPIHEKVIGDENLRLQGVKYGADN
jgi:hypothetical protein